MKIRLLSDLHTEFRPDISEQKYLEYCGEDVLVLAGDIASGSTNTFDVIKKFKKAGFPEIVFVSGNHEYYGTEIRDFDAKLARKCEQVSGVHFLNPGWVKIGDTVFIGGTLWTDFRGSAMAEIAAATMIADFRLIRGFRPSEAVLKFIMHLALFKAINAHFPHEKKVFVSHFLPAVECISPRFRGSDNLLNNYFANDLGEWIETLENSTWLFGHTHDKVDVTIGTTRLLANPYGYYGQETNPDFDNFFVV